MLPEPNAAPAGTGALHASPTLFVNARGRLRAGWRLLTFALLTAAAWLVLGLAAAVLAARLGLHMPAGPYRLAWLETASTWSVLLALVVAHAVMLRWIERRPWSFVRLGRPNARPRTLATGLLLGALAIGVPSLLLLAAHWLLPLDVAVPVSWERFLVVTLALFPAAALMEELLVRGYAFAVLRETWGWQWTLVVTSVIFGLLHLGNPGVTPLAIVNVALAGAWLAGVLLVTESLYAAWMAHFAWNWVMIALLHTEVSGLAIPVPDYRLVDAGPDWLTGGPWGPEGGALAIAGMAVAMVFLVRRRVRRREQVA